MITVRLTERGTVALIPKYQADLTRLHDLPYVKVRRARGATFWTYLADLRRDVPSSQLRWHHSVRAHLADLKAEWTVTLTPQLKAEIMSVWKDGHSPYEFQQIGIAKALHSERLLLADSTGLGKTWQTLGTMLVGFKRGTIKRAVLVVPAGLKLQWYEEAHTFCRDVPEPFAVIMAGTPREQRKRIYARPWRVLIINPELLRNDAELLQPYARSIDFAALDEASAIRNPDTLLAETVKDLFRHSRYKLALTATPIENRLHDLYSIFQFVDPRAFISRAYFDERYITWRTRRFRTRNRKGKEVSIKKKEPDSYKNLGEVEVKIRHCYLRRTVEDVGLELPDLVVQWDTLDLSGRQRKVYEAVKDQIAERLKKLRGAALRAPLQTLRQVCNSTALVEKEGSARPVQVKVDRIRDLLETDWGDEQVILFTDYERFARILLDELGKRFGAVTYTGKMGKRKRDRSIDAFVCGDKRVLIGTKALERGHNLQNAAIVCNVDLPFNPAAIKQRLGRIRRLRSKHKCVRMINLIVRDTVEERLILRRIYAKRALFEGIFEKDELTLADPLESMAGLDLLELL